MFFGIICCISDVIPAVIIHPDRCVFISFFYLLHCILSRLNRFRACCFQPRSSNDYINQALSSTGLIPRKIDLFVFPLSSHREYQPPHSLLMASWQSACIHEVSGHTKLPGAYSQAFKKLSYWLKFSFICLLHWRRLLLTKWCNFTFNFVWK